MVAPEYNDVKETFGNFDPTFLRVTQKGDLLTQSADGRVLILPDGSDEVRLLANEPQLAKIDVVDQQVVMGVEESWNKSRIGRIDLAIATAQPEVLAEVSGGLDDIDATQYPLVGYVRGQKVGVSLETADGSRRQVEALNPNNSLLSDIRVHRLGEGDYRIVGISGGYDDTDWNGIAVWQLQTAGEEPKMENIYKMNSMAAVTAVGKAGRYVAIGAPDGLMAILDVADAGKGGPGFVDEDDLLIPRPSAQVQAVDMIAGLETETGAIFAAVATDGNIKVIEVGNSGENRTRQVRELTTDQLCHDMCVVPTENGQQLLALQTDGVARVWDIGSGELLHEFELGQDVEFARIGRAGDQDVMTIGTVSKTGSLRRMRYSAKAGEFISA